MLYAGPQPDVILLTLAISFVPSIILTVLLRFTEKYDREPWGSIWTAFLWGATGAVVLVILARGRFLVFMEESYPAIASDKYLMTLYVYCLLTPVVAELIKILGLFFVRTDLIEAEDGLIYGAVIGLGFAATETMLHGIFLYSSYGIEVFIRTVLLRVVSVVMLQGSLGAIAGYGITRAIAKKHKKGSLLLFPVFLLIAIVCHAAFNYIANSTMTNSSINMSYTYALVFSIAIAGVTWTIMWIKIFRLDRMDSDKNKAKLKKKEEKKGKKRGFFGRSAKSKDTEVDTDSNRFRGYSRDRTDPGYRRQADDRPSRTHRIPSGAGSGRASSKRNFSQKRGYVHEGVDDDYFFDEPDYISDKKSDRTQSGRGRETKYLRQEESDDFIYEERGFVDRTSSNDYRDREYSDRNKRDDHYLDDDWESGDTWDEDEDDYEDDYYRDDRYDDEYEDNYDSKRGGNRNSRDASWDSDFEDDDFF